MITFTELYDKIYTGNSPLDSKRFVQIVESSKTDVLALVDKIEQEDRSKVRRFVADYAINLASIEYTKNSLIFLNKAVDLFQKDETFKGNDLLNEPTYESLILNRAKTYYVLDNYRRALNDFKLLRNKFGSNDLYRKGYDACMDKILTIFQWITLSVLAISISSILLLELEAGLKCLMISVLVLSLILSVSLNFVQRKKRKEQNKG
ncbi:MAG: hypothetical protein PHP53_16130 [Prolixibacteraceae bacterium]|nr:hypothetical protein [Prolixibacteraceae bacterium]